MTKMGKVELKMNKLLKFETIIKLVDHNINKKRNAHNSIYQEDKSLSDSYI